MVLRIPRGRHTSRIRRKQFCSLSIVSCFQRRNGWLSVDFAHSLYAQYSSQTYVPICDLYIFLELGLRDDSQMGHICVGTRSIPTVDQSPCMLGAYELQKIASPELRTTIGFIKHTRYCFSLNTLNPPTQLNQATIIWMYGSLGFRV